jgi:8-hydroxy-5-deazaflavin:NADPH oxidoreductase
MKLAVLGTGAVGNAIATKLIALGHEVRMGSREAKNEKGTAWAKAAGANASSGTFAEAASFGELVFVCTNGSGTLPALAAAGAPNLEGKVLVDVTNPLDFSKGFPPSLSTGNGPSLGEQIQSAFPGARVVKSLNTVTAELMVDPGKVPGPHAVFVCGNDAGAKAKTTELLQSFGWKSVIDLGDIGNARGTEAYVLLWVRLYGSLKTASFNIQIVR